MSEKKKFLLRIDEHLYDALEKWAADEFRSVNAQIEYILAESVRRAGRLPRRGDGEEGGGPDGEGVPRNAGKSQ